MVKTLAAKTTDTNKDNPASRMQKAEDSPSADSPFERILFLQRTIGNRAVQRLMKSGALQAKLWIGAPGDIYEQEADSSGGNPLPEHIRAFFESRLGHDFSQVRVHEDAKAAEAAQAVNARAFTVGRNVVFEKGEYSQQSSEITNLPIQRAPGTAADVFPDPVDVIWGGDTFRVSFERKNVESVDRFYFVINYTGKLSVDGPFIKDKTQRISVMIGSGKLDARIRSQRSRAGSSIEIDLYGDGSSVVKLTDAISFDNRPSKKGREHDFTAYVNGKSKAAISMWVLDPKARASDIPPQGPEEIPGENPHFMSPGFELNQGEALIDGDGDQYKELLVRLKVKSYWKDTEVKDAVKSLNLQIVQRLTGETRQVDFDLPKPEVGGALFPLVEEVTDGKVPTKISLVLPSKTRFLEIYPPATTSSGVNYRAVAAGSSFSFQFPPEKSEIHTVASPGMAGVIGGIVSVDIALGAYGDRFRLTVEPKSNEKAVFGISALYRDAPVGGMGADLQISGQVRFQALLTGATSLGLDLDGDKKPDLMMFDQLTTPAEVDGGGPPESNRNHRIRVTGSAIGGDKLFYFSVRDNYLIGTEGQSAIDKMAASNAQAVRGLTEQAKGGVFENQLDAYERELMLERKKAYDTGLIRKGTYEAWAALSLAMIRLRPQITGTVNTGMQTEAARQAEALYKSLAEETRHKTKPVYSGEFSSTSVNPYTDELTTIAPFYAKTVGSGSELAGDIKAGRWDKAFPKYQKLVSGLDQWILDRLKGSKGEGSAEAQRVGHLVGTKRELGAIEGYKPRRILAVFHPDEKFKSEQGYISEVPLDLYAYREGGTWHLKDLTNPDKPYDYRESVEKDEREPPFRLIALLNDPDHFPLGVIHYDIPGHFAGEIKTTDYLTWKKFFTYLGIGLAAVGLTLSTFGTGTVAVVGVWALAGSALAGGTAATIDLIERGQHGNLDTATAVLDVVQIVASLAGASALAAGRIVQVAANAPAQARWAGAWARLALVSNRLYVPLAATAAGADVMTFAVLTIDSARQLDEIQNGPGNQTDKDRAKALLLSQLALAGGLTALSLKGTIPSLTRGRTLVLHPGPDGVPVVSTALAKNSIVIDSQTAIALEKKAMGLPLQEGEKAMIKRIEALGDVELRVADTTAAESAIKGGKGRQPGIAITADRAGKEYQDILKVLTDKAVGRAKGTADRTIVADTFFAVTEPGVKPTFATHDSGIYNPMARIAGYEPAKGLPVPEQFPNGFDVTINGRTIHILPISKK